MDRGVVAMAAGTAIGVWLYVAPGVLGYEGAQATVDRIGGALLIALFFVAIWEFMRGLRIAARPIVALLVLALPFTQPALDVVISTALSALAAIALSLIRGDIKRPYGGGWRALRGQ